MQNRKKMIIITTLIAVFICSLFSQSMDMPLPMDESILSGTLENGLTYYIKKNAEPQNMAEFKLGLKVGSLQEDDDQLGVAHFVEHLAFNGSKHFPADSLRAYLNSIGSGFLGGLNGMTSQDFTIYQLSARSNEPDQMDKAVLILSDWATNVSFLDEAIDKERAVILEEMRGGRGAQERRAAQNLSALYEGTRIPNRMPIGTEESIQTVPYKRIRDFYHDWYRPDLMSVVVIGDFDPESVESLIHKYFEPIEKRQNPRPYADIKVPEHEQTRFSFYTDTEATSTVVSVIYKHPWEQTKTIVDYRRDLVSNLLNFMLSNRFTEISNRPDPPFVWAGGHYHSMGMECKGSMFALNAMVDEAKIIEGFTSLLEEVERAKQKGFYTSEFKRAKDEILKLYEKAYLEKDKINSARLSMRMVFTAVSGEVILDPEFEYMKTKALIDTISLDEIIETLTTFTRDINRVVTITSPENITAAMPSEESLLALFESIPATDLDIYPEITLSQPLMAKIPKKVKAPKPKHDSETNIYTWNLKNGITVYLKPTDFKNNEIVFNGFRYGGFSLADDQNIHNARLAPYIMAKSGAGPYNESELDIFLSNKDVSFSTSMRSYLETIRGKAAPGDFETAMQLLYHTFTTHRYDEDAYASTMNSMEIMLRNAQNDPERRFDEAAEDLLYNYHPRMKYTTVDDLQKVSHKDTFDFYKSRFSSAFDYNFFFVGNISAEDLQTYIETYVTTLPAKKVPVKVIDRGVRYNQTSQRKEIFHGNDDKSIVTISFPTENGRRNITELDQTMILRYLLFEALVENVRDKMSGVYYVYPHQSSIAFPEGQHAWEINFGCDPNRVDEIIAEVLHQLRSFQTGEFDDKYMQTARESVRKRLEVSLRDNGFWLTALNDGIEYNFPFSTILDLDRFDQVTREDIAEMTTRLIDFDRMLTTILYPEDYEPQAE
ncbi:MAG: insulinase family protein [Candidatus Cloacimonetes bacterium]|nr:insulinase family protein [Candidatus Cloacimonadota bacterium]